MNANARPISVVLISCLYIAVGAIGFAYHFPELMALHRDSVLIELTELLAVVSSQKTEKPAPPTPALQKKLSDLMPAIMGEIIGGSAEIGAKVGAESGTEIEKEHPEYVPARPKSDKL